MQGNEKRPLNEPREVNQDEGLSNRAVLRKEAMGNGALNSPADSSAQPMLFPHPLPPRKDPLFFLTYYF